MMGEKQKTSIKIDPDLWNEAKKLAIDRNITVSQLMENLIRGEIGWEEENKKGKG